MNTCLTTTKQLKETDTQQSAARERHLQLAEAQFDQWVTGKQLLEHARFLLQRLDARRSQHRETRLEVARCLKLCGEMYEDWKAWCLRGMVGIEIPEDRHEAPSAGT